MLLGIDIGALIVAGYRHTHRPGQPTHQPTVIIVHMVDEHSTASDHPALPPPEALRQQVRELLAQPPPEPKRHRIRRSITADGFGAADCSCGWTITTDSWQQRQHAINHHLAGTIGHLD